MKIIGVDNYDRDHIADFLVCENVTNQELGMKMIKALNDNEHNAYYYQLVADDHRLSRGMADLV